MNFGRLGKAPPPRWPKGAVGRLADIALAVAILALAALVAMKANRPATTLEGEDFSIIDGDSLRLGGTEIRLKGIDAPEYGQTCRKAGADYPCGRLAWTALADLAGKSLSCTGGQHDRYGRLLAVCRSGEVELNRRMVESGWALAYGGYADAEAVARRKHAGIWAGSFERPQDWRRDHGKGYEAPHAPRASTILDWLLGLFRGA